MEGLEADLDPGEELLVQGMGSLMGLCPPPERWRLLQLCEPFHILPSRLTQEDMDWLTDYADMKLLTEAYTLLNQVVSGYGEMPQQVAQRIIDLCDKAEARWLTSDSGS